MKKFLSVFLVFTMVLGLMTACGGEAQPPETSAPTQTPETTEGVKKPVNIMQKSDPSQDDTINILMIGNSFCYYYADELVGMAAANGIKLRVSNVYYSGCAISQHYTWWKNGERNYRFITHDENGRTEIEGADLEYCLKQGNWDVISLQGGGIDTRKKPVEQALEDTKAMRAELWEYIKTQFPMSKYYWHHTWSYQIGYDRDGVSYTQVSQQHERDQYNSTWSKRICNEDGLIRIPSGEAWRRVRDGGYDNLCERMGVNGGKGDYYHDGDTGGGQYLNACVWFERVLGQNCVGNTWRPDYNLSEDMIAMLQQAAHDTVALLKADEEGM